MRLVVFLYFFFFSSPPTVIGRQLRRECFITTTVDVIKEWPIKDSERGETNCTVRFTDSRCERRTSKTPFTEGAEFISSSTIRLIHRELDEKTTRRMDVLSHWLTDVRRFNSPKEFNTALCAYRAYRNRIIDDGSRLLFSYKQNRPTPAENKQIACYGMLVLMAVWLAGIIGFSCLDEFLTRRRRPTAKDMESGLGSESLLSTPPASSFRDPSSRRADSCSLAMDVPSSTVISKSTKPGGEAKISKKSEMSDSK